MEFLVVGLNHRTAPLEVREKITLNSEQVPSALTTMAAYGMPGVILSTCNRSEFYALDPQEGSDSSAGWGEGEKNIKEFLVDYFHIRQTSLTLMEVPNELVPAVRELIAKHQE